VNAPASRRHSKVAAPSSEANVSVASRLFDDAAGPDVIEVSGRRVSIAKERVAGVGSVCPVASVAVTETVCAPSASGPMLLGEVH